MYLFNSVPFVIKTSSGLGAISNAKNPSTSSKSFELNLATKDARPEYGGVYLNVPDAVPETGTSAI